MKGNGGVQWLYPEGQGQAQATSKETMVETKVPERVGARPTLCQVADVIKTSALNGHVHSMQRGASL